MAKEIKNAIITSASLSTADRGFLDAWLSLDYGGSGQGFGGYVLYLPKSFKNHQLLSHAGHFIARCMDVAEVTEWSNLTGKSIRVELDNGLIKAIGHIIKNDWFNPSEDFKKELPE